MDIEKFDRLYPTPAHAAHAESMERTAARYRETESRDLLRDRSGAILVTAALAASLLGGLALVSKANQDQTSGDPVKARIVAPARRVVSRQIPDPVSKHVQQAVADVEVDRARTVVLPHPSKPTHGPDKPATPSQGSSDWILHPLSGDALAAALIVDKRQTVELNAEQLRLMAEERGSAQSASRPVPGPSLDL